MSRVRIPSPALLPATDAGCLTCAPWHCRRGTGPRAFVPLTPHQLPQDSAANSMTRVYSPDDRHVAGESYMSQRLLPIVVIDVWRDGEGRQRVIRHEDLAAIHALDGLL